MTGRRILAEFLKNNFFDHENLLTSFDKLTSLYNKVNSVINISAIKNEDDIYIKHYLDSIYPFSYFSGDCGDVGCGGGFPCLPLSIVTDLSFTGIESVGKKLTLIHSCVTELNLKNIKADYSRSEDAVKKGLSFDTVCARAVADTDKVLSFCAPLCRPGGKIILYKTKNDYPAQTKTEKINNVKLLDTVDYTLPETDINRRLFIYIKK